MVGLRKGRSVVINGTRRHITAAGAEGVQTGGHSIFREFALKCKHISCVDEVEWEQSVG
jgi:hypothetical protein